MVSLKCQLRWYRGKDPFKKIAENPSADETCGTGELVLAVGYIRLHTKTRFLVISSEYF